MIDMNSTRSVRWTVNLGMARPITVSLSSLVEGGGNITMLKVVVSRVYTASSPGEWQDLIC